MHSLPGQARSTPGPHTNGMGFLQQLEDLVSPKINHLPDDPDGKTCGDMEAQPVTLPGSPQSALARASTASDAGLQRQDPCVLIAAESSGPGLHQEVSLLGAQGPFTPGGPPYAQGGDEQEDDGEITPDDAPLTPSLEPPDVAATGEIWERSMRFGSGSGADGDSRAAASTRAEGDRLFQQEVHGPVAVAPQRSGLPLPEEGGGQGPAGQPPGHAAREAPPQAPRSENGRPGARAAAALDDVTKRPEADPSRHGKAPESGAPGRKGSNLAQPPEPSINSGKVLSESAGSEAGATSLSAGWAKEKQTAAQATRVTGHEAERTRQREEARMRASARYAESIKQQAAARDAAPAKVEEPENVDHKPEPQDRRPWSAVS